MRVELAQKIVIALDGPSASGKSTLARLLAERMSFIHLDSGALYRLLTFTLLENIAAERGMELEDFPRLFLKNKAMIDFKALPCKVRIQEGRQCHFYKGQSVDKKLRSPELTRQIYVAANDPDCRSWVNRELRAIARSHNVVVDGRDIGSEVFPDAPFKFFIEASLDVRAKRRRKDLEKLGHQVELQTIQEEIRKRDEGDKIRKFGSLRLCPDAVRMDNSHLSLDESLEALLAHLP